MAKLKINGEVHEFDKLTMGEQRLLATEFAAPEDSSNADFMMNKTLGIAYVVLRRKDPKLTVAKFLDMDGDIEDIEDEDADSDDDEKRPTGAGKPRKPAKASS